MLHAAGCQHGYHGTRSMLKLALTYVLLAGCPSFLVCLSLSVSLSVCLFVCLFVAITPRIRGGTNANDPTEEGIPTNHAGHQPLYNAHICMSEISRREGCRSTPGRQNNPSFHNAAPRTCSCSCRTAGCVAPTTNHRTNASALASMLP